MPISVKPKVCYELTANGSDAAGFGPTLTGGGYNATYGMGDGFSAQTSSALGFNPNDTLTIAYWVNFNTPSFVNSASAYIQGATWGWNLQFYVENFSPLTFIIDLNGTTIAGGITFNNGWDHIALSVSAGTAQLYINGVAVGSTFSTSGEGFGDHNSIAISSSVRGVRQTIFHNAAYSAADITYLYNGGTPLPYSSIDDGTIPPVTTIRRKIQTGLFNRRLNNRSYNVF